VGDLIAGAKVVRINRNAVDVTINDQARTLKMAAEMKEGPIVPPAAERATAPAAAVPGGTTVVSRSEIEAGLQDMGSMLRQAQVRPYFTAGLPDGFMISQIRPGSLYQKMGVMDGDIIQEVNSRRIQTADDLMGLLNIVKSGSSMSLTIRRRGNQETLNYQFQ
jgi:general secretion pathway protein C